MLDAAGAEIIGPCANFEQAESAVEENGFDCAILDLNLHGRSAAPIADRLIERGKSFAIATGYGSGAVPERLQGAPRIEKPFNPPALVQLIAQVSCAAMR
jgi:DNA-binding NtrC family response regulator